VTRYFYCKNTRSWERESQRSIFCLSLIVLTIHFLPLIVNIRILTTRSKQLSFFINLVCIKMSAKYSTNLSVFIFARHMPIDRTTINAVTHMKFLTQKEWAWRRLVAFSGGSGSYTKGRLAGRLRRGGLGKGSATPSSPARGLGWAPVRYGVFLHFLALFH